MLNNLTTTQDSKDESPKKRYALKHFNDTILTFGMHLGWGSHGTAIYCSNVEEEQNLISKLPLDLRSISYHDLERWLHVRLWRARHNLPFLFHCGFNRGDLLNIAVMTRCLSLNDPYWICEVNDDVSFEECNLYDNKFDSRIAQIALTGTSPHIIERGSFISTPEFTTRGMLPKAWRRIDGEIRLYKADHMLGKSSLSEFYAFQVAQKLGLNAIKYGLSKWHGSVCAYSKLFTSKDVSYIPIGRLGHDYFTDEILNYYAKLGAEAYESVIGMFMLDAIIINIDRHSDNFGVLVDNAENKIIGAAPIYDNGGSLLFCENDEEFNKIIKAPDKKYQPYLYLDFFKFLKGKLNDKQMRALKDFEDFRFKRHPKYNLGEERLTLLEDMVKKRAKALLKL